MDKPSKVFDKIYGEQLWSADGRGSGRGSTKENAQNTVKALGHVLHKYKITRLLDAPCGALEWTEDFLNLTREEIPDFNYCGVDVVESVVAENESRMGSDWCKFVAVDLAVDSPPNGYDLILCRDALQHNSYQQIAGILKGFSETDTRYLLVTSFSRWAERANWTGNQNRDIETGLFFPNNLKLAPFNFTDGILESLDDKRPTGTAKGHKLLMYDLEVLRNSPTFKSFLEEFGVS